MSLVNALFWAFLLVGGVCLVLGAGAWLVDRLMPSESDLLPPPDNLEARNARNLARYRRKRAELDGQAVMVGESGPELFVSPTAGDGGRVRRGGDRQA
jgi:hypothetical protein